MGPLVEKNSSLPKVDDESLLSHSYTRQKISSCSNCGVEAGCRRRVFSEQAWTLLLLWNEINPQAVDQPICDECYLEIREILIDRSEEVDLAIQEVFPNSPHERKSSNLAG